MKRPIPTVKSLEPVIRRESRYWLRNFRGMAAVDDLAQEGRIVAMRVIDTYDPSRGMTPETLLTSVLRRHYRRLCKQMLTRALLYTETQRNDLAEYARVRPPADPIKRISARLLLARAERLTPAKQRLVKALIDSDGKIRLVAKSMHWSPGYTYTRVAALRALLLKGDGAA